MIQWSLTLSEAQISVLKAFVEMEADEESSPLGRFSHFLTHTKGLLRDGLIVHTMPPDRPATPAQMRVAWRVTEKGRLVLRVIEIELQEIRSRHLLGDGLPVAGGEYLAVHRENEAAKKKLRAVKK